MILIPWLLGEQAFLNWTIFFLPSNISGIVHKKVCIDLPVYNLKLYIWPFFVSASTYALIHHLLVLDIQWIHESLPLYLTLLSSTDSSWLGMYMDWNVFTTNQEVSLSSKSYCSHHWYDWAVSLHRWDKKNSSTVQIILRT